MDVQLKTVLFKPPNFISVLLFLKNLKTLCVNDSIHEGPAMRLLQHFIQESAKAALSHRVTVDNRKDYQQHGKLTTYRHVANYLLGTYETYGVIAQAEAETNSFKKPARMTAICYHVLP